jgi:hypothetical protein
MSDGHYCVIRDLGPVKGGKGMKHHEVIMALNPRGLVDLCRRWFVSMSDRTELSQLIMRDRRHR